MSTYLYAPEGYCFEDAFEIESQWDHEDDAKWIVEEAAADFHSEHDGWESSWPLELVLWLPDGTEIGTFTVEREFDPVFSARKQEKAA